MTACLLEGSACVFGWQLYEGSARVARLVGVLYEVFSSGLDCASREAAAMEQRPLARTACRLSAGGGLK